MTTGKIRWLVLLMTLAMFGLVAVQTLSLKESLEAKQDQFDASVTEALDVVSKQLEKIEIIVWTNRRIAEESKAERLMTLIRSPRKKPDSTAGKTRNEMLDFKAEADVLNRPKAIKKAGIPLSTTSNDKTRSTLETSFDATFRNLNEDVAALQNRRDSIGKMLTKRVTGIVNEVANEKAKQKSEVMREVFLDIYSQDRPLEARLDFKTVDSLLKNEFSHRNIKTPFEFGIRADDRPNDFIYTSTPGYKEERLFDGYVGQLFPFDLKATNNLLYVYFPSKQNYITEQITTTLLVSVVLVCVMAVCFYIALGTIFRQRELSMMKNEFINNMTHEFKTPVSTISLAVQMLKDETVAASPTMLKRYLGIIQEENHRLGGQVEKVLQAARFDRGEVKFVMEELDFHELIETAVESISPQIEARNGKINVGLSAKNSMIFGDPTHLINLIFNLLDNANKYSPEIPEITISTTENPKGLKFSVQDQGLGMSKDETKHIFEQFYRVPTGNRHDVKGFGLGLSYVKKIVEEHQASISVVSVPKEGTTFTIIFPHKQ